MGFKGIETYKKSTMIIDSVYIDPFQMKALLRPKDPLFPVCNLVSKTAEESSLSKYRKTRRR